MGHYPSSVKELIMAQAENRRKLPMAFLCDFSAGIPRRSLRFGFLGARTNIEKRLRLTDND
jgi:hypothetical protein